MNKDSYYIVKRDGEYSFETNCKDNNEARRITDETKLQIEKGHIEKKEAYERNEFYICEQIRDFANDLGIDHNGRYKSFDHCFFFFKKVFSGKQEQLTEELEVQLALNLYAYLASWGMLRNSFLMQKDYYFLVPVVKELYKKKNLLCFDPFEKNENEIKQIKELYHDLRHLYDKEKYIHIYKDKQEGRIIREEKEVIPSDTLITKILMGTLGVIPAYDRFLKKGLSYYYNDNPKFLQNVNENNIDEAIKELCDFAIKNKDSIDRIKKANPKLDYPTMKWLDVFFWKLGGGDVFYEDH